MYPLNIVSMILACGREERHIDQVQLSRDKGLPEAAPEGLHSSGQLCEGAEAFRLLFQPHLQRPDQDDHSQDQPDRHQREYRTHTNNNLKLCLLQQTN